MRAGARASAAARSTTLTSKYGFRRVRDVFATLQQRVDDARERIGRALRRALEAARERLDALARAYGLRELPRALARAARATRRARAPADAGGRRSRVHRASPPRWPRSRTACARCRRARCWSAAIRLVRAADGALVRGAAALAARQTGSRSSSRAAKPTPSWRLSAREDDECPRRRPPAEAATPLDFEAAMKRLETDRRGARERRADARGLDRALRGGRQALARADARSSTRPRSASSGWSSRRRRRGAAHARRMELELEPGEPIRRGRAAVLSRRARADRARRERRCSPPAAASCALRARRVRALPRARRARSARAAPAGSRRAALRRALAGQAPAPAARAHRVRGRGRRVAPRAARGGRGRVRARVLARARRPAGDGRRRLPPRPADDAQEVRRGARASWPATRCWRSRSRS